MTTSCRFRPGAHALTFFRSASASSSGGSVGSSTSRSISGSRAFSCSDAVRAGLLNFDRGYPHLRPFEQRELIRLMLHRAVLGDHEMVLERVLEINGRACGESRRPSNYSTR